ncbi:MAG: hypothetical protein E7641_03405 [Ruminococcaceae bacterium]|nr:hypothetical protein [Oscillospiraceae bacterium]
MLERSKITAKRNLSELRTRIDILKRQKAIIATCLSEDILTIPEISLEEKYGLFSEQLEALDVSDKLCFCRALIKDLSNLEGLRSPLRDTDIPVPAGSHGKIAFIRNNYNDLALKKLSAAVPHSKSVQKSNFEDCCEAVASGECEFAVIPVENTSDGKMFGFYSLIDRYELRICAVCSIESDDLSKTVRYALVGRNFISDEVEKLCSKKPRTFEFSLLKSRLEEIDEIISAVSLCSSKVLRVSSVEHAYDSEMTKFYFSCSLSRATELDVLTVYLQLEHPQYDPIGIYREL